MLRILSETRFTTRDRHPVCVKAVTPGEALTQETILREFIYQSAAGLWLRLMLDIMGGHKSHVQPLRSIIEEDEGCHQGDTNHEYNLIQDNEHPTSVMDCCVGSSSAAVREYK